METFVNDSLNLYLDTEKTLTGYDVIKIKYKDPDGTTGEWSAEISPSDATHIKKIMTNLLTVNGVWQVQAYVAMSDGSEKYHGKWASFKVLDPLYS